MLISLVDNSNRAGSLGPMISVADKSDLALTDYGIDIYTGLYLLDSQFVV